MRLLELPNAIARRGILDWPDIVIANSNDEVPVGMPYIRNNNGESDYVLLVRLLIPKLQEKFPGFNWNEIYEEITGKSYQVLRVYKTFEEEDETNREYGESVEGTCDVTLDELASDLDSYIDLDLLSELSLLPKFFGDLADVIKVNVTNEYLWNDGYNKKTGMCTGYLTPAPRKKSLVILDLSYSIPDGVSASMMTLIQTITEITHADLILTAGQSYFYTNEEVKTMDIEETRESIPRGNESHMFIDIFRDNHMDYDSVISFGDSDAPRYFELHYPIHTKKLYDFFVGQWDAYGTSYKRGTGYARWVVDNNPDVEIIRNYEWAHFFK